MRMTLLLPALVAVCYAAALPQSIVTETTISAPEPTFTFVIPCIPLETNCIPRTVTIEGRDTPEPTFGFGIPSESIAFGDGVTETAIILPRQSLVTGTTISAPQETFTVVIPCYPGESSCVPRTITLEARDSAPQSLGSVSRSAPILPTYSINTADTSAVLTERQVLGSPTRTVLEWPGPTITVTTTVYVTTPYVPSSISSLASPFPSSALSSISEASTGTGTDASTTLPVLTVPVNDKRQVLGKPTRSVIWY